MTEVCSAGFPHSDICGSMDICSSPQLFAAYHVFLRLLVPRHPPCALSCLTFLSFLLLHKGLPPMHSVAWAGLFPAASAAFWMSFLFLIFDLRHYSVFKVLPDCCQSSMAANTFASMDRRQLPAFLSSPVSGFLSVALAATCSPIPSPVQYHRPLRS